MFIHAHYILTLKEPQLITRMSFQVSKDDRSDIESSSDEETDKERLKTGTRSRSQRGENGINGHFGPKSWSQNHSDWWQSLHVAFTHRELPEISQRDYFSSLYLSPTPKNTYKTSCCGTFWDSMTEFGTLFQWWWDTNDNMATIRSLWKRKWLN